MLSSLFRIFRSSMKLRAVIVQSTLPNMIITILSIEAGSFPRVAAGTTHSLKADFQKYTPKPLLRYWHSSYRTHVDEEPLSVFSVPSVVVLISENQRNLRRATNHAGYASNYLSGGYN